MQSRVRNRISSCRGVRHASQLSARALAAMPMAMRNANGTGPRTTHFLKLIHVAKIGTKPCELDSHRLRTNSSHLQPCFSGSFPGCAGRARPHMLHMAARSMCSSRPRSPMHNRPSTTPRMRELTHAPCVQLIHYARSICSRASQDEVLVRNCGHCLKAAHQTLLIMLAGVLALELLVPASLKNSVLVVW